MKNRKIRNKKQYGFTLVELMVVVAIIAILTMIGVGGYATAMRRGRDARRKSDIQALSQALMLYRMDWAYFPHPTEYFWNPPAGAIDSQPAPGTCGPAGAVCRGFHNYIRREGLFDPSSRNFDADNFPGNAQSIPYTYICASPSANGRCRSFIVCAQLESRDGGNLRFINSPLTGENPNAVVWPPGIASQDDGRGAGGVLTGHLGMHFDIVGRIEGGVQWYCASSM